ncbi:MAG TPA: PKD domain-containing protein [Bacteroidia bacterium]|jgi:gliding motility-associated-like protein|nr:PKD domain-containing protein [Bacteroidia bacterium]
MNSFPKFCFILFNFLFLFTSAHNTTVKEKSSGIRFTENKNQWDKKIRYRAQLDGGVLFLERNCFTYSFYDKATLRATHFGHTQTSRINQSIKSHAFRVSFVNALPEVTTQAEQKCQDFNNYFIGNDETKWASHVGNYKEVIYDNIYQGINIQLLGKTNSIKYNFFVAPHANPDNIQMNYEGLDSIYLEAGNLKLVTSINQMTEQKPYAYQFINGKQVTVPCNFVLTNKTLSYQFPNGYDKNIDLIIDPVLSFACSSGSTADNFGMSATYDEQGNLYSGGTAFDQGYPITTGAIDVTFNGGANDNDVVITKFDSSGTFLHYSTYLGGSSCEIVSSMIVNAQGELYIFGTTGSSNFPTSTSAYDKTFNGGTSVSFTSNGTNYPRGTDLYVCHFNSAGTSLLASTYIGGSENEGANNSTALAFNYGDYYRGEMLIDNAGNAYVASTSYSSNFPVTAGCLQASAGGGMDGVVFKMPGDLSKLTWSTYLGGSSDDGCYGLNIDNALNVFVAGGTASSNFPVTPGSFKTTYGGGQSDGFISKIKSDGTGLSASTFVGTNLYDQCFLIQFDKNFDVYTVGQSLGNMPVSAGVYSNAGSKQFIWKMNNNLSSTSFTTIFGNGNGKINISPTAFLVDRCDNIYVSGWGGDKTNLLALNPTENMPLTSNAYQSTTDGYNFYLFVLTANAQSLLYGSYFGGASSAEHVDGGTSRFDKKGVIYQAVCSGCGGNDDFPVTPGSWPNTGNNVNHADNCNIGVFKFDFQMVDIKAIAVAGPNDTICVNGTISFKNTSKNATSYSWDFGDSTAVSTVNSPTHTYTKPGNYTVTFIAINNDRCTLSDTLRLKIVVLPIPNVNIGRDTIVCNTINLKLDAGNPGFNYLWSTGAKTQTIQATTAGVYWVKVSNGLCEDADTMEIKVVPGPIINLPPKVSLCKPDSVTLNAENPGCTYLWSTGETGQTITVKDGGVYTVTVSNSLCSVKDTTVVIILSLPKYSLDTTLCAGQSLKLKPNVSGANYTWSTGATTESITVDSSGLYWVDIRNTICHIRDTMIVKFIPLPIVDLPVSQDICSGDTVKLDAGNPGFTHVWSTGDTTQSIVVKGGGHYVVTVKNSKCFGRDSTDVHLVKPIGRKETVSLCNMDSYTLTPRSAMSNSTFLWSTGATAYSIDVTTPGVYWVKNTQGNCTSTDTITVIGTVGDGVVYIPNSFSPDNNRTNDVFRAVGADIIFYHLSIFDRWGELIFEANGLNEGWDGYYNGTLVQNDVYVWVMNYRTACDESNLHTRRGIVSVIR